MLGGDAPNASTVDANGSATNGHAQGSLETKPAAKPERIAKPAAKASTIANLSDAEAPAEPTTGNGTARAAPVRPAAKPKPEPKRSQDSSASTAGAADWSGMHPKSTLSVKLMWVYVAAGAVFLSVVGVWQLGYSLGKES